jgi:2-methylfumaryl-CoA isomerase
VNADPVLSGLRVLEVSAFVAAPLAGVALAELGAEVVRVDPLGGGIDARRWPMHEGRSLYWTGLNQAKRSVNIDTRSPRGRALVADLIVEAGVCLTNLPPADWMSYTSLTKRRPDLIMVMITGNADGSAAVDYTINAAVGFPWITGPEGWSGPVNHVLPAWDVVAGQMAVTAVIAAELKRARTRVGSFIKISLSDVALSTVAHLGLIAEAQLVRTPRARFGNYLYGSFGRDFPTADGRQVIVIALTPRQWRSLVEATGCRERILALEQDRNVDLTDEDKRWLLREEIAAIIGPWIGERALSDVGREFDAASVLWGPYQSFKQLLEEDPRASPMNPLFADVQQPGLGPVLTAASPIYFDGARRVPPASAPAMGEHTREVLASWLNLSSEDLDSLAAERVIATL